MKKKDPHDNPTPETPGNADPGGPAFGRPTPPEGQRIPEHDISDTGNWGQEWGPESAEAAIERVSALEHELDETKNKLLRTIADYQNSQRRALQNEQQAKADGVSRIVSDVATILDHFDLALGQDPSKVTVDQLVGGVRVIREELLKVLGRNGVSLIEPKPNDEFQPGRHEAVMQQPAEGIEPGHIVATFAPGFLLTMLTGERIIRPARVAVAPNA